MEENIAILLETIERENFDRLLAYHQIRQYFLLSKALYSTALSNVIKELSIVFYNLIITVIIFLPMEVATYKFMNLLL